MTASFNYCALLVIVNLFTCFLVNAQEAEGPIIPATQSHTKEEKLILDAEELLSNLLPESSGKVDVKKESRGTTESGEGCSCSESAPLPETLSKPAPIFAQRFDWIRLTSDEWLKGDILSMYEEELEFDSEELDILTLDWEDIAEIRSKGLQSVRLVDGSIMEGWISMKDGVMEVTSNGETYEFDSLSIMTIASSSTNLRELWDGEISVGVNVNKGNSETLDYTFTANIQRRTASNRLKLSYVSNFSESTIAETGVENITADSKRFTTIYDFFYTDNIFIRAADLEYFSDPFQNVADRYTYGVAIGYPLIKEKKINWDVTLGPGYQKTTFSNVQENANDAETSFVASLGTSFDYEINKQLDVVGDYQLQLVKEESGRALHQFMFGLEVDVLDDFDIDLTYYLNRTAVPRQDENGDTPEKNDYRFVVSLGYTF